ncbi:hypothetical protein [Frigidibacter oleivorans]|uniref:hypothetical protein n=1 Tax=Frigidibacter oleivorans TaxID=2487129 RepID=UPI000F8DE464|nr:hypothetical protein [Frigidibacter oleivorans]
MSDQIVRGYNSDNYRRAWKTACELGRFTAADIAAPLKVSPITVRHYISVWERNGEITFLERQGTRLFYQVAKAEEQQVNSTQPLSPDPLWNMWAAARLLQRFTPLDIAIHANTPETPVSEADASAYCQLLLRGGYLRVLEKARPPRRRATYRLIRNTGPEAPVEKRVRAVLDPNLGEYVHIAGASK